LKCFIDAAPDGQAATQFPHPRQITSLTIDIFLTSSKEIALYEQTDKQDLQPIQKASDI
jgi:hypothetical protein